MNVNKILKDINKIKEKQAQCYSNKISKLVKEKFDFYKDKEYAKYFIEKIEGNSGNKI